MRVSRPIFTLILLAVFIGPEKTYAAEPYNSAQLKYLFSGIEVDATGGNCGWGGDIKTNIVLKFEDNKNLSVNYTCDDYLEPFGEKGSGNWKIEYNKLCLTAPSNTQFWKNKHLSGESCWRITAWKVGFAALDSKGGKDWTMTLNFHPKHSSREELWAALNAMQTSSAKTEAITLPPAPYKALPRGTRIKYDDRIYRVTRSDGFLTTYRSVTGNKLSYLYAYALFGEYADNLYVSPSGGQVGYKIKDKNRKKLEGFWPLEAGKKVRFILNEGPAYGSVPPDEWEISLEVSKAEEITLNDKKYKTFVIEEEGRSETGKIYVGRKWYHPPSGLIIKATRTWKKAYDIAGSAGYSKSPNFEEGEEDNYSLVRVRFPEAAVAVAAKQDAKKPPAVSATDAARLKQAAEKARAQEIARLKREAEEKRKAEEARKVRAVELARLERKAEEARAETARQARAQELARLEREAEEKRKAEAARQARTQELARLEREAEENRQAEEASKARAQEIARLKRDAEAARKAREAEIGKATVTEMARLEQEAEAVRRVHEAEIADLKREAETIRKAREARETEIARLKLEAEKAENVRLAEVARLKREAKEFQKALARRNALEAEEEKARKAEIARLKQEAEDFQKALAERDALEAREEKARKIEIASLRRQLDEFLKARTTAEAPKAKADDGLAGIDFGNYHALIIGIDNYKNLPKLTTAIKDARGVAKILKEEYGFKVSLLIDPDRLDIIDAFDELRETLGPKDNLLIYYAGHGWLDEDLDRGFWMPVDAKPKRRGRWISNATITDTLKGLSAKHVMVVADSCYSGTLVRAADVGTRKRGGEYWKEMASKWARVAITSGGLEPVADKGGSGHSPFAKAFIDALRDNDSIIDGLQLFGKMRRPVMIAADQTPQYADVRQAGHDGGDFLFVRKK